MTATIPPIISVDDHLVEPPTLWTERLPARYRDRGPHVVSSAYTQVGGPEQAGAPSSYRMASGDGPAIDFWVFEDGATALTTGFAAVGQDLDSTGFAPITYAEMRPGCYDLKHRLSDMDINGVERSLCFPTVPRFCGQLFLNANDKDLALQCIYAYNDFMVDEWAGDSGGRLIPLCLIPLWDPALAADEVRRNAARGVRAVAFSEAPQNLGLPSVHNKANHWDPFFKACDETGTVLCMHIGSGARPPDPNDDAPIGIELSLLTMNAQRAMFDWLLSGHLVRFPNLKIALSEAQIGWMPYVMEQADRVWEKPVKVTGLSDRRHRPSSLVKDRIFGCFFHDDFGIRSRYDIGVTQLTLESDYPHQDSTWPHTSKYAEESLGPLPADEVDLITRGNAIRLFGLPENL